MLSNFIKFVEDNRLKVESIIITIDGVKFEHYFTSAAKVNVRSISKILSCLGVQKAIERNLLTLESNVMQFFGDANIHNAGNLPYLRQLKIKHLLTFTMGHEIGLLFKEDIERLPPETDFVNYVLNYDIKHEPGSFFVYTNAATYLLCAIVQKLTGKCFNDWAHETVLQHLDIEKPEWETSNQGVSLGACGLYLTNAELHRIGLMFLNNGRYGDRQIIDSSWIDEMRSPQIFTAHLAKYSERQTRCLNKMAYGYHLWICGDGSSKYPKTHYFVAGADGKFFIISPKQKMAITILSHQEDTNPFYEILSDYLKY